MEKYRRKNEIYIGDYAFVSLNETGGVVIRQLPGDLEAMDEHIRKFANEDFFTHLTIENVKLLYDYISSKQFKKEHAEWEKHEKEMDKVKLIPVLSHEHVFCEQCNKKLDGSYVAPLTPQPNVTLVYSKFCDDCNRRTYYHFEMEGA